jgi:ATP-dependent DNA helicase RecG
MAEGSRTSAVSECQHLDRKSLRTVTGRTADFVELAKDCVCFANGSGGQILIGIEDDATEPPPSQRVPSDALDRIRKRVGELTVNVDVAAEVRVNANGGEYVALTIPRAVGVASTSDGRYFLRIGDDCRPVVGDDVLRLVTERPSVPWETMTSLAISRGRCNAGKRTSLCATLRASDRVKASVREKTDDELLDHYGLAMGEALTNLGVLLLGTAADRARLGTAPVVQALKHDERGVKVAKHVWDDHALSPVELIDAVWQGIPDFRESYELPDGLFRMLVPAYDEAVVRELLVNALVHRPYTQRGDVFLNLHPDRLEVVNAGRLPLGVTPRNILHASRRRNDGLARVFHDLKLMEREGSGFDLMYDRLLTSGRAAPTVTEGTDSVHVVVPRRVLHPGVIRLIAEADPRYQLSQRERIVLGLLGQSEGMLARELLSALELGQRAELRSWLGRLVELGLVRTVGRTKGTRYFLEPSLVRDAGIEGYTTLARIEPHRLRALIEEDVRRYPGSSSSEIQQRVGAEVSMHVLRRALKRLIASGTVRTEGEKRWTRYFPGEG